MKNSNSILSMVRVRLVLLSCPLSNKLCWSITPYLPIPGLTTRLPQTRSIWILRDSKCPFRTFVARIVRWETPQWPLRLRVWVVDGRVRVCSSCVKRVRLDHRVPPKKSTCFDSFHRCYPMDSIQFWAYGMVLHLRVGTRGPRVRVLHLVRWMHCFDPRICTRGPYHPQHTARNSPTTVFQVRFDFHFQTNRWWYTKTAYEWNLYSRSMVYNSFWFYLYIHVHVFFTPPSLSYQPLFSLNICRETPINQKFVETSFSYSSGRFGVETCFVPDHLSFDRLQTLLDFYRFLRVYEQTHVFGFLCFVWMFRFVVH